MSGFSFLTVERDNGTFNKPIIYSFRLVPLAKFDFLTTSADVANRRYKTPLWLTFVSANQKSMSDNMSSPLW